MPMVHAMVDGRRFDRLDELKRACLEVVPAGLHSQSGPMTPGSIEFFGQKIKPHDHLTVDVVVIVEAYHFDDRANNLDERSEQIRQALSQLFPFTTFGVWVKLVQAGWASDSQDPESDVNMSMDEAIKRAMLTIAYTREDLATHR